jgi:UDP-N-acetylglucosamine--N-acetylmuramyl-(pentapeptide) pyrophosphoryl-undecaprenol N-acetylglucosamine transferase
MSRPAKFLVACGGTGGHLAPGIALAEALQARGHGVTLFISHKKVDARLCEKYPHLATARVPGAPLGLRPDKFLRFAWHQARGVLFSFRFLRAERPDAIVGFGGFTNAAVVIAGRVLGIPVALHEANRVPGRAVRWLSRVASRLYLPPGVRLPGRLGVLIRHTGLPVRAEIARLPRAEARARLGVDPAQRLLVLLGGSQGAGPLNDWAERHLADLAADGVQVWCVTGPGKGEAQVRELRDRSGRVVRAWFEPFTDRVATLLSAADLVVSRAGAGTIAELVRCETPAVLVPYPHAADNHQAANARYFEQQGGGVVVEQHDLGRLQAEVREILGNDWLAGKFRENLRRLASEDALAVLVPDLEALARREPPARHLRHAPASAV